MIVAILAVFLAVFLLVAWWYSEFRKCNKYLGKYPGPTPTPVIGNALKFSSVTDTIPVLMDYQEKYGGTVKIFVGHRPRLILMEHKVCEFLLGSSVLIEKSYEYKYFYSWLGTGLLTSSGAKWKRQRRLITPTFHFQILEQFIGIFDSQSNTLVKTLRSEAVEKGSFDIFPYITMCALDVICEAAMGTTVNAQIHRDSDYVLSVKEMCRIILDRTFSALKMSDLMYRLSRDYRKEKKALHILHGYTNSVIRRRKRDLLASVANKNTKAENDEGTGIKKRMAFLDLLLQCTVDGQHLPDEMIREEVDTFMFEGHDTTTSGISFVLYCLSQHPEIQERVVEELRSIFGNERDRPTTYQDLQDMKYLELVVKETMRLYPPVPMFSRMLLEDVEYDGGILPKGLALVVFVFGLHRNPEYFPDPEVFDPERFTPENSAGRSPYVYVPFSAGARNCIGQRFAMLEMKSTVAKVLRNFEILPVVGHMPILAAEAILKSANGLPIRLKERIF